MQRRSLILVSTTVVVLAVMALLFLVPQHSEQPKDPYWGKTTCAGCRMAISSMRDVVQILGSGYDRRYYDDLGCAIKDRHAHPELAHHTVFVRSSDAEQVHWLDARTVHYSQGLMTPMGFGFAVDHNGPLKFADVERMILERTLKKSEHP